MIAELLNNPVLVLFWFVALIVSITIHEFAHAWAADRLGDPTPSIQGRLTLDPRAHLDPIGTLMILFVRFGWGKPVQFDPYNLRNPRRDAALISIAGPLSNIAFALLSSLILRIPVLNNPGHIMANHISNFLYTIVILNINLAIFNLIPIHPLDGFKIVGGILSPRYARQWYELQNYGIIFLLLLVFPVFGGSSPVFRIILPVITAILNILLPSGTFM